MDTLTGLAADLGSTIVAVWACTELIGKHLPKIDRRVIGVVLGPVFAVLAYRYGFINLPAPITGGLKAYGAAAFGGLIATLISQVFHDFVSAPIAKKMNGG